MTNKDNLRKTSELEGRRILTQRTIDVKDCENQSKIVKEKEGLAYIRRHNAWRLTESFKRVLNTSQRLSVYPIAKDVCGEYGKMDWEKQYPGTTYFPVHTEEYFGNRWWERVNDDMLPIPSEDPAYLILGILPYLQDEGVSLRESPEYDSIMRMYKKMFYRTMTEQEYQSILDLSHPAISKVIHSWEKSHKKGLLKHLREEANDMSKKGWGEDNMYSRVLGAIESYSLIGKK